MPDLGLPERLALLLTVNTVKPVLDMLSTRVFFDLSCQLADGLNHDHIPAGKHLRCARSILHHVWSFETQSFLGVRRDYALRTVAAGAFGRVFWVRVRLKAGLAAVHSCLSFFFF